MAYICPRVISTQLDNVCENVLAIYLDVSESEVNATILAAIT